MSWPHVLAIGSTVAALAVALVAARPRPPILPPRVIGAAVPGARVLEARWDALDRSWRCTGAFAPAIPVRFYAQAGHCLQACDATLGDDSVRVWYAGRAQGRLVDGERAWVEMAGA